MGQSNTKFVTVNVADKESINELKAEMLVHPQRRYDKVHITFKNIPVNVATLFKKNCEEQYSDVKFVSRKFLDIRGTIRIVATISNEPIIEITYS